MNDPLGGTRPEDPGFNGLAAAEPRSRTHRSASEWWPRSEAGRWWTKVVIGEPEERSEAGPKARGVGAAVREDRGQMSQECGELGVTGRRRHGSERADHRQAMTTRSATRLGERRRGRRAHGRGGSGVEIRGWFSRQGGAHRGCCTRRGSRDRLGRSGWVWWELAWVEGLQRCRPVYVARRPDP